MKQTKCFLGAAALLMLASCTNENLDGPQEPNVDGNVAYATLNITMANMGTRAGEDNLGTVGKDFQYGTDAENAVKSVFAVFYNTAGKVIGTGNGMDITPNTTTTSGNVANTVTLQIMLTEGSSPADAASVVAFVNYGGETSGLASKTLSQLKSESKIANDKLTTTIEGDDYFKMTNSGYYNAAGNFVLETDCDGAVYVLNGNEKFPADPRAVDVYVERLAAKVELAAVNGIETQTVYAISAPDTPITLTFTPTAWDVTAIPADMYAVKNMPASNSGLAAWMYTPAGSGAFRSYWAQSPNYSNADQTVFPITGNNLPASPLLRYVTQGEATNLFASKWTNEGKSWTPAENTVNYTYVPENTFDASVLTALKNPYTATTALVIEGSYNIPAGYEGGFYLRTINGTTYMYTQTEAINALVDLAATNFKVGTEEATANSITATDVEFKPLAGAAANAYYIQLKALEDGNKYFTNISGNWEELKDLTSFNKSYFKDLIGSMNYYMGGNGFYYIPLKHYFTAESTDALLKEIETGNYGVVRNNWYSLTVNSIKGFASGFGNPADQPKTNPDDPDPEIPDVPTPDDDLKYGLNVSMKVLQWHMRNQSVDL